LLERLEQLRRARGRGWAAHENLRPLHGPANPSYYPV